MRKNKKPSPRKMTDEELMQITGGVITITEKEYDSIQTSCSRRTDSSTCTEDERCMWSTKDTCVISQKYAYQRTSG